MEIPHGEDGGTVRYELKAPQGWSGAALEVGTVCSTQQNCRVTAPQAPEVSATIEVSDDQHRAVGFGVCLTGVFFLLCSSLKLECPHSFILGWEYLSYVMYKNYITFFFATGLLLRVFLRLGQDYELKSWIISKLMRCWGLLEMCKM